MDEKEYTVYVIPANFTNAGRIFGGMFALRNAVEMIFLVAIVGFLEFSILQTEVIRAVIMTMTLLPLALVSLIGVDSSSLLQYLGYILRFLKNRRKLHYKMGYSYDSK